MSTQTFSIAYVSRLSAHSAQEHDESSIAIIADIQRKSPAKNHRLNIRGVLLVVDGIFFQWLEGEEASVRALLATIKADTRHTDMHVVLEQFGPPILTDWSMALVIPSAGRESVRAQFESLVSPSLKIKSPAALMRYALKPGRPPRNRRRIALFGQTDMWSSATMAARATRMNVMVSRTRMANHEGMRREALLEYVDLDLPQPFGPVRLLNLSGEVLALEWMTGVVEEAQLAVLLYSTGDPIDAHVFSERVAAHLANAPKCKVLCLFGRAAASVMETEKLRLSAGGRSVAAEMMPLSNAEGIWQLMEREMPEPEPEAAPESKSAPESAQVLSSLPPKRRVSVDGAAWLRSLLALDAVEAAGIQDGIDGQALVCASSIDREIEKAVTALLADETAHHAWFLRLADGHAPADGQEILTRYTGGVTLSASLPAYPGAVVVCRYAAGFHNEALAMRGLRQALQQIPPEPFEAEKA